jgi:hypothetical protein
LDVRVIGDVVVVIVFQKAVARYGIVDSERERYEQEG